MLEAERARIRSIKSFPSLVKYLRDDLDWPIDTDDFEDLTFDYEPQELGIDPETAAKIDEIKQLRPMASNQPWGIFFIKFEPKRLPVVVLRRILSQLVIKKRASGRRSEQAAWDLHDLLFISNYGEDEQRQITFAHFSRDEGTGDLPTLRVLGWDDADTALHIDHVHNELKQKLCWPDDASDIEGWRTIWSSAFVLRHREVIRTSQELAIKLADLAKRIRKRANHVLAIETEKGPLRKLHKAFQEALIHDLNEDDFADMYAQTIAYGLLAARVSRPLGITADNVADMVPITNPFLKEMLSTFLTAGGRKGEIDFDELGVQEVVDVLNSPDTHLADVLRDFGNRTRGEDPVIHFYELFLSEYDRQKRIKRGVFFTPLPVVSYIVRSVHEILQTEFGLVDGLADITTWGEMAERNPDIKIPDGIDPSEPFVQILDPATGTGTFLVEVIDVIHNAMMKKWQKEGHMLGQLEEKWNEYVPKHLLPRLYGYELMMAPYAIAHMKIGLKLSETGYRFSSDERVRVYLTNSLETATDNAIERKFEQLAPSLAHEAKAVNEIKRGKRFTVLIGNPPYAGISSHMTDYAQELVDPYKIVDGAALNERKIWLQDDYVKFMRQAQVTIEQAGAGILGYITNHGYLDNPTFRGMRQSLMHTFQLLWALDLHGNSLKKERAPDGSEDKNVFEIRQGVAVCIGVRGRVRSAVLRADLWGNTDAKYNWLTAHSSTTTRWDILNPTTPFYFFRPADDSVREYGDWPQLSELMPTYCSGVITARDELVLDYESEPILDRIALLRDTHKSDDALRQQLFGGKSSPKYAAGDSRGWKLPEARKKLRDDRRWRDRVATCLYRPFDRRYVYLTEWMVDWSRPELRRHLEFGKNPVLVFPRNTGAGKPWDHAFVSYEPILGRFFPDSACITYMAPMLVLNEGMFERSVGCAGNFRGAGSWGVTDEARIRRSALEELGYIYAILYSATYRERYLSELRADFPRIPSTGDRALASELTRLGSELVVLHLLESPKLDKYITQFVGKGNNVVASGYPKYNDATVWINTSQGFKGVPEGVWDFHIGGYQVCHKWLKDRKGRVLSEEDIDHYQKIVVALNETIRLMGEIDEVIEEHGGWPGAFVTGSDEENNDE